MLLEGLGGLVRVCHCTQVFWGLDNTSLQGVVTKEDLGVVIFSGSSCPGREWGGGGWGGRGLLGGGRARPWGLGT